MKYLSLVPLLCVICAIGPPLIKFCHSGTAAQHQFHFDRRKLDVSFRSPIPALWQEHHRRHRRATYDEPVGSQASPFSAFLLEVRAPPRGSSGGGKRRRNRPDRLQKRTKKKTRKSGQWQPVYEPHDDDEEEELHVEEEVVEEHPVYKPPLLNPAHDVSMDSVMQGVRIAGRLALRLLQSVRITHDDDSNEVDEQRERRRRRRNYVMN